jgi:hypothetical protein
VFDWYYTKFGEYLATEMKDFCQNADIFQYEGTLPFLKKRGWALLNVALWWKQYIGSAAASDGRAGQVPWEPQPFGHRSIPLAVESRV